MTAVNTTDARRQLSPGWMLFVLTGLNLLNYLDRYVLNAVRTPMADTFGISYGDSGRMFTAFMIGYFLTSPLFGWLGDRFPRKWLIAAGIFVWSLGTMLTGFAGGFATLLFYRVLVGVGEASYATISPSLISDTFGGLKRNNALTIFYVAIPVGSALGYVVGGEISGQWGWRYAFIWAGLPGLLLALVLLPFREPRRGQADLAAGETLARPGLKDFLGLFRNVRYQLVVWGYVAYTFALGAFAFWGPTYFEKIHHLSTAAADRFFGIVLVVSGLVGTLVGGFTATAWQRRNPAGYAWLLTLSVLAAAPLALLAFLSTQTVPTMCFLAAAMFLLFLSTGPVNTLILETVPVNLRTSAMALSIFLIHLFGDMWSPEIVGRLADRLGGDLQKAVLILPGVLLVSGAFWLALALKTKRSAQVQSEASRVDPLNRSSRRKEAHTCKSEIRNPKSEVDQSLLTSAATGSMKTIGMRGFEFENERPPHPSPLLPRGGEGNEEDRQRASTLATGSGVFRFLRGVLKLLLRLIYRVRVEGRANVPAKGGALLVCNHVSFVDALLVIVSTNRRVRFMMHRSYYDLWWMKPFNHLSGIIPIASAGPRELVKSLQTAGDAIRRGEVVCVFAEGGITRTGELMEFQRGFERIMKGVDAPILPVALVGVWGSIFSYEGGKVFWKRPRRIPYPVTVRFGKPLPPTAAPDEVRAAVNDLINRGDAEARRE